MKHEDIELRDLRYFVALAEELHFGHAALRLAMTQPSLTKALQRLEKQLGVELFYRSRRRVELTHAGMVFLQGARRTIAEADNAYKRARVADRGEVGRLRLGFVASATHRLLPGLLREFRNECPAIVLELHELNTSSQIQAFRSGQIEVGLVRPPVWDEGLEERTISQEPFVVALPKDHPLASSTRPINLKQLAVEPLVLFPREITPGFYDHVVGLCHAAGFEPRIVHECTSFSSSIALVSGGVGVALIPHSLAPRLEDLGGVYRKIRANTVYADWAVVWRRGLEQEQPQLKAFLSIAQRIGDSATLVTASVG